MLRRRLITVLTFVDGVLFRSRGFEPDYRYTSNFVDAWSVDEIVILDISRPGTSSPEKFRTVLETFAKQCFVPVTAGGGIRTRDDVARLLQTGADKATLNTGALNRPELITEVAESYGAQCVVLSIDARKSEDGTYQVFSDFGAKPTGRAPADWAREAQERGAGEILLTSIERDGSLSGYEIELCQQVSEAVSIPVLICGGAGNWKHFVEGFERGGADAVCTANIYHFTETSIRSAKEYLIRAGIPVRL